MSNNTPKLPKTGGAEKAAEAIKKFRNQQPSDRLVKIISEYSSDVATVTNQLKLNNEELKSNILMNPTRSHILLLANKMHFLVDICNIYVTFVLYRTIGVRYVF